MLIRCIITIITLLWGVESQPGEHKTVEPVIVGKNSFSII